METPANLWSVTRAKAAIDAGDHDVLEEWLQNAKPENMVLDELMQHCLAAKQDHLFALLLQAGASSEKFVEQGPRSPLVTVLQKDKGDVNTLKLILDKVKNSRMRRYVNTKDKKGYHPLFLACENGHFECARILIEKGAKVNSLSCFDSFVPLMAAAEKGHLEMVKLLIEKGANVNKSTSTGERALYLAAKMGHINCVKALLQAGANVNAPSKCGESALMNAVKTGGENTFAVVQELVAAGADVTQMDWRKQSALCYAASYSTEEVALYLADKLHEKKVHSIDLSLRRAVERGHTKLVQKLLENGWDINLRGKYRENILHVGAERGVTDCLAFILESEYMKQLDINEEGGPFFPLTPLHLAIRWSHPQVVELFLKHKADPDWCDHEHCSALVSCMSTTELIGRATSARLLLRHGCDLNALVIPKYASSYGHDKVGNKTETTLGWALRQRELWMAHMVWAAGARAGGIANWSEASLSKRFVYNEDEYTPSASKEDVLNFIQNVICKPRTLQDLCRIIIRANVPRSIHQSILTLPLPPHVKYFVNVEELDEIEAQSLAEDEKMREEQREALERMEDFDLVSTSSGSEDEVGLFW